MRPIKLGDKAVETGNIRYCNEIGEYDYNFKDECIRRLASSKKDPSICENIRDDKNSCYTVVAALLKNNQICEKITDETAKEECISEVDMMSDILFALKGCSLMLATPRLRLGAKRP